jgi:hypothetical protein
VLKGSFPLVGTDATGTDTGAAPFAAPDAVGLAPDAAGLDPDVAGTTGDLPVLASAVLTICRPTKKYKNIQGLLFSSFLFFL